MHLCVVCVRAICTFISVDVLICFRNTIVASHANATFSLWDLSQSQGTVSSVSNEYLLLLITFSYNPLSHTLYLASAQAFIMEDNAVVTAVCIDDNFIILGKIDMCH